MAVLMARHKESGKLYAFTTFRVQGHSVKYHHLTQVIRITIDPKDCPKMDYWISVDRIDGHIDEVALIENYDIEEIEGPLCGLECISTSV